MSPYRVLAEVVSKPPHDPLIVRRSENIALPSTPEVREINVTALQAQVEQQNTENEALKASLANWGEKASKDDAELRGQVARLRSADAALHEVARQAERWKIPMPRDNPGIWVLKIMEEVGEFSAALLGQELGQEGRGDVLEELNQIIAVALTIRAALEPRKEKK